MTLLHRSKSDNIPLSTFGFSMPNSQPSHKTALVTGAASGIGQATAERLAADGVRVIVADVDHEKGQVVADAIHGLFIACDLRSRTDCHHLVNSVLETYKSVDILINNAGFQHVAPIESFPEDIWEDMLRVMLTAPFLLTRYVWPVMQQRRWGRIVNISSIHGQVASPFKAGYVSAKHGLLGLTKTTALEGAEYGITVNAICPAYVRTPLVEQQISNQAKIRGLSEKDVVEKVMLEPAAVKRLIEPSEVADVVAYLCSEAASAVTGAAWSMDLGWTAR